jgi:hypothetical protein
VADQIRVAVFHAELEISVVRREPLVEHVRDGEAALPEVERAWRFFPAVARVTLDPYRQEWWFVHGDAPLLSLSRSSLL